MPLVVDSSPRSEKRWKSRSVLRTPSILHMRLRPNRTLILALLVAMGTCYYYFNLLIPRSQLHDVALQMGGPYGFGGDFYPIWLTGRALLFHGTNPYTQETTRAIQTALFGRPMDPRRPADPPTDFRAFA